MKYNPTVTPVPTERRADINSKVLTIVDRGILPPGITHEDIFNGYTGIGGLHGLERKDYENYYQYSKDKKEIEQGQFFTYPLVVEKIVNALPVSDTDIIGDLCCGAGAFFNCFNETQCFGCDIDIYAVKVAKFLYPGANIECVDIRYYHPSVQFDFIVGNPPFNLIFKKDGEDYLSQYFYCLAAAKLLKPGGILCCIVPDSFLKDEFFSRSMVDTVDKEFHFLCQYKLPKDAFENMGVKTFDTKVICFQAHAESIEARPYKSKYNTYEEACAILQQAGELRRKLRVKLHREQLEKFGSHFTERVKKYMFEIKTHPVLKPYVTKATAKLEQFYHQKQPDGMKYEEWMKTKLTENKVLGYLKRIIQIQSTRERDEAKLVTNKYGIWFKSYSRKALNEIKKTHEVREWSFRRRMLVSDDPVYGWPAGIKKLYDRKLAQFKNQKRPFKEMERDPAIDAYLDKFRFLNNKDEKCRFNDMQKQDLGLILQKDYAILNWQQGTGKTAGAAAWARLKPMRNTFIISAALGIELTWTKFMKLHKKDFVKIERLSDVYSIKPGMFILCSLDYLIKYQRHLKKYMKSQGHNVNVIFDESDEITNAHAKRTYAMLSCFRRAKRKLCATGTTTRNNITEIYSQLEFLYNNSFNLLCECSMYWLEKEDGSMSRMNNPYWGDPFPARGGAVWFKRCFNPSKTTVFGIQRHDQSIYNEPELRKILEYTIVTRKFKEIAGDKYTITAHKVKQNPAEEAVYSLIIHELNVLLPEYFTSTGNARKDAMLRILRQMQLLIKATSVPHLFKEYESLALPSKAIWIFDQVKEHKEKIAIGCTSLEAVDWYHQQLINRFPFRPIFKVIGEVSFKGRENIRKVFESTENGILLCTQQSLKSSVNIPTCSKVIIESKQWNIPKIEQFFFRFIRYDSPNSTEVMFINYENTIEMNLMALLMAKERLNDYIKTLEFREESSVYDEYDIDLDILNSILTREEDEDGKMVIRWGAGSLVA